MSSGRDCKGWRALFGKSQQSAGGGFRLAPLYAAVTISGDARRFARTRVRARAARCIPPVSSRPSRRAAARPAADPRGDASARFPRVRRWGRRLRALPSRPAVASARFLAFAAPPPRAPPRRTPSRPRRSRARSRARSPSARLSRKKTRPWRTLRFPRNRRTCEFTTISCLSRKKRPVRRAVCARCLTRTSTTRGARTSTASCGTTGTFLTSTRYCAHPRRITSRNKTSPRSRDVFVYTQKTSSDARV